ncbi:MAG: hypothetical protein LAT64_01095 [Phycisphaerales bacterium]|nr:hypothetical protein [Planctomycetota bacterium]MCH8507358.1 hypothetical protein [Phycisphaerales bacterium]
MNARLIIRTTAIAGLVLAGFASLTACAEERIVSRRGLLSSLPGAESNIPDHRTVNRPDILRTPSSGIRETLEDGDTVILHAKSVRHLMAHIVTTMQNGEEELFVEQVLSSKTRQEFVLRGYDPAEAYKELIRRERDVFRLFNVMPFGEQTPGLFLQKIGDNEFRLQIPRSSFGELRWTGIDVVFENKNYRLRWFVAR